jgi:hypothetical protein
LLIGIKPCPFFFSKARSVFISGRALSPGERCGLRELDQDFCVAVFAVIEFLVRLRGIGDVDVMADDTARLSAAANNQVAEVLVIFLHPSLSCADRDAFVEKFREGKIIYTLFLLLTLRVRIRVRGKSLPQMPLDVTRNSASVGEFGFGFG